MVGNVVVITVIPGPAFVRQIPPSLHVTPKPGLFGFDRQNSLRRRVGRPPEVAPEADVVEDVVVVERHGVGEVIGFGQPVGQRREGAHAFGRVFRSVIHANLRRFDHLLIVFWRCVAVRIKKVYRLRKKDSVSTFVNFPPGSKERKYVMQLFSDSLWDTFLVADMQLYKRLCPSVGPSAGPGSSS